MNQNIFKDNREKLQQLLDDKSINVFFAGSSKVRSADEDYEFVVNRNFYYLTGINESKDILVIVKNNTCRSYLFINRFDELKAKWVGATLLDDEVKSISMVDEVRYLDEFYEFIGGFINANYETPYTVGLDLDRLKMDNSNTQSELFLATIKEKFPCVNFVNIQKHMATCRMVKSEYEVNKIIEANNITKKGVEAILSNLRPGIYEYQIESMFDQQIKWNNASGFAFKTIAASSKNACVLHYSSNNCILEDNELILFDLGAACDNYCADVSRTFPINGKFTQRQKQIYNIVLSGQEEVFKAIKPGVSTRDLNQVLVNHYAKELKAIGLIKEDSEVSRYYFHGVSHHLGLDTHDVSYASPLTCGCVITVEPGLYIKEENIGIRIEDDVVVVEDGYRNLTQGIVKTVEDIEEYMAKSNCFLRK